MYVLKMREVHLWPGVFIDAGLIDAHVIEFSHILCGCAFGAYRYLMLQSDGSIWP